MERLGVFAVLVFGMFIGAAIASTAKKPAPPCDCSAAIEQALMDGEIKGMRYALDELRKADGGK